MSNIGIIVLAAGGSTRMGQPKQFLPYKGRTLLWRAVDAATLSTCEPVIVVVGDQAGRVSQELSGVSRAIIEPNPDWKCGIGTSIRAGIRRLMTERPDIAGALILLCDQPAINAHHLRLLCETHVATDKEVVASEYGQTLGPPCFFAASWFDRLLAIADGEGAKRLILSADADRAAVPLPGGEVDIDTPSDYDKLTSDIVSQSQDTN